MASVLRSLDWPDLQVIFGLGYDRQNIDDTLEMAARQCLRALSLIQTRCLFSTNLAAYLLNNRDEWTGIDLTSLTTANGLSQVQGINIEIDVTTRLDHMFVLAYLGQSRESPSGWYLIQSYVNQYTTRVDPVDALELIQTIQRWRINGVDPQEWRYYFHADIPSTNKAIPHVYATSQVYPGDIRGNVEMIRRRMRNLQRNPLSYIHDDQYECLI